MFDIGFPELILVSIVALLVVGPDRLPETIRTVALWVGGLNRSLANIKQETENEIGADEIRQELHNESILKELHETRDDLEEVIRDGKRTFTDIKTVSNPVNANKSSATSTPEVDSDNDRSKSESGG
ncbi:MAG: twin-arginine translocase subunit TatB [Pseudomonadales bacterium]|nr:twin-arginine translocase subunit TatB [Pseudomonadales bacterium]